MPGHKGVGGIESHDLTEVSGADSLFEADGIIRESEENAGAIFGAHTLYSTEGSSLSIRAMLHIATLYAKSEGKKPLVLAARNVHRSFVSAAALIDFDIEWLYSSEGGYLSCRITAEEVEKKISEMTVKPTALYLTSPDYLGNIADILNIGKVCKRNGILLLVDNAHGAYLKFTSPSLHPIDLGADMCADSAHKTLHALTGAGYLHIAKGAPALLLREAKSAMSLFASTSPSYLILESLDRLNAELNGDFSAKTSAKLCKIVEIKRALVNFGYTVCGSEPMKISLSAKALGYTGAELSSLLYRANVSPEFADEDFLVLMPSPDTEESELDKALGVLTSIEKREPITDIAPRLTPPERVLSPREAIFAVPEEIPVESALGRVLASVTVACPPAVPILVSGEKITEGAIEAFKYYGTKAVKVIKK